MEFIPLIAQLVALTASVTLIWLIVRAFKKHPGWGFAVLLLSPPGAMTFGIKYWEEEKQAFLAYLIALCMAVSLGVYMFMTWDGAAMIRSVGHIHPGIQSSTPSKTDAADFKHTSLRFIDNDDPGQTEASNTGPTSGPQTAQVDVATDAAQAAEQAPEAVATVDEPVETKKKPVHTRLTYVPIMVSDADKYVGHTVKVTRRNVPEKEYRLTGVSPRYLKFTQKIGGGSYSFQYKDTDIEKIRVLVNQPY